MSHLSDLTNPNIIRAVAQTEPTALAAGSQWPFRPKKPDASAFGSQIVATWRQFMRLLIRQFASRNSHREIQNDFASGR